jgi:hypothetical protein
MEREEKGVRRTLKPEEGERVVVIIEDPLVGHHHGNGGHHVEGDREHHLQLLMPGSARNGSTANERKGKACNWFIFPEKERVQANGDVMRD